MVPPRPYSLALTAARFARFPEVVDRFDGASYKRLLFVEKAPLLVTVSQSGPPARATLRVRLDGKGSRSKPGRAAALRLIGRGLGAEVDLAAFYRKLKNDPILGGALHAFRGLRIGGWADPWEALVSAVLSQQVNLKFAYDIRRELALAFGRRARFEGETYGLSHARANRSRGREAPSQVPPFTRESGDPLPAGLRLSRWRAFFGGARCAL